MRQPFAGPPGVPAERVAILRAAFDAMTRDPAFLADAAKSNLEIDAASGAEVERVVRRTVETSPDVVGRAQAAMAAKTLPR